MANDWLPTQCEKYGHYCPNCDNSFPNPEPTSPSVSPCKECARHEADAERLAIQNRELKEELIRRNQEIEDLRLTNRNLSRKIVEDARKRGEAATQQPSWPRGVHGS